MIIADLIKDYSVYFSLKKYEYEKLVSLLLISDSVYSAFVLSFLKEVDADINKVLRIINVGIRCQRKVFNKALANFIVTTIKEAIILTNYKEALKPDGFVSVNELSRLSRFELAIIDRQTIIRTFKKYGIIYNTKG